MALALLNRAKMTVSGTPGTGTITLNAASTGFQTFATAGVHDGARVPYLIEDGSDWEYGLGDYTASGTTLARTVILGSSNSGSAISATSSAVVSCVPLGQVFPIHAGKPNPNFSSAYNVSDQIYAAPGASQPSANNLFFLPFTLGARRSFNRIGLRTGTVSTPASIRFGIYRDSINGGAPGRLLIDAGFVTGDTSNTTYEVTISLAMTPGLYWFATSASSNAAPWFSATSSNAIPMAVNSSFQNRHAFSTTHTYGALPSDLTSSSFSLENVSVPLVHLRTA